MEVMAPSHKIFLQISGLSYSEMRILLNVLARAMTIGKEEILTLIFILLFLKCLLKTMIIIIYNKSILNTYRVLKTPFLSPFYCQLA